MWNYSDNEFIKIYRKMLNWEWYTDVNTTKLFLHCLLRANWKPGRWRGYKYDRGQFITSLAKLSKETGLTVRQVRTALEHLIETGEVTSKNFPRFRIITVLAYDDYQKSDKVSADKTAGKRQGTDKVPTTDIRTYKNSIRTIEEREALLEAEMNDPDDEPWPDDVWEEGEE